MKLLDVLGKTRKKANDKGFTLVELIVVLVILAILAAILVPALLGYIDRARSQQIVLNARSVYTAAQAEATSLYAKGKTISDIASTTVAQRVIDTADVPGAHYSVGVTASTKGISDNSSASHSNYTITYVYYEENNKAVELVDGEWVERTTLSPSKSGSNVFKIK